MTLNGAYLWNGVEIGDNCNVYNSVLCDNVGIRQGVTVNKGCILSFNVVIGAGVTLKEFSRITLKKPRGDDDDEDDDNLESELLDEEERKNVTSEPSPLFFLRDLEEQFPPSSSRV